MYLRLIIPTILLTLSAFLYLVTKVEETKLKTSISGETILTYDLLDNSEGPNIGYPLEIEMKDTLFFGNDSWVRISPESQGYFNNCFDVPRFFEEQFEVSLRLISPSVTITPSEIVLLPYSCGNSRTFVITPRKTGKLLLLLQSSVGNVDLDKLNSQSLTESILEVLVLESPVIMGLPQKTLDNIRLLSVVVGLPSLLTIFVNFLIRTRRKRREEEMRKAQKPKTFFRPPETETAE